MKFIIKICSRNPNPQRLAPISQARRIVSYGDIRAACIVRIISGNCLQHEGSIFDRRCQRPHMIQRPRKWNYASRRDASIRRLEAHASAKGGWFADRARSIGSNRGIAKPGSDSRSRSARRSSGDILRIPRILHITEKAHQRTAAVSKFVQIILAKNHSPSLPQPPHHLRILLWNAVPI